jgi:hypothetical protein
MDIHEVHEPKVVSKTRTYTRLTWRCTCGAFSVGPYYRSKTTLLIAYELEHRQPGVDQHAPEHTFVERPGGFGGTAWACSCGEEGRPEGHPDARRARQAHKRHAQAALLRWLQRVHQRDVDRMPEGDRRKRLRLLDWYAKDEKTRAEQTAYVLSNLL